MYTNEAIAHLPISVEHLDPTYLYWALRSVPLTGGADRAAMGSTLNKSKLAKIRFPLPPLEEQKRIAAILDKADELQGKRRAAIAHLDSLTQAIFLDMFGDPDSADSVWPIAPLADLISPDDRVNYGVVQPGPAVGDGVPMVRVSDFTGGTIRHGDIKQISSEIESKYRRSRLRGDEVLLSCVGTIGEVAVATIAERGFNIARAVTRIPTGESLRAQYLAHLLRTKSLQRRLTSELRTVAQPTLNIKQIKELSVPLPPIEMQQTFEAAAAHSARVARLLLDAESCSRDLAASLQVRAFRGEL
jgi:type I restriction enzyme S subunit